MDFTSCIPIPLISLSLQICPLPLQPHPQIKTKIKRKTKTNTKKQNKNKKTQKKNLVEAVVWSTESHSSPISPFIFPCKYHCHTSLVQLQAPGFCYTTDNGLSLGLLLDMQFLPCAVEILLIWICTFIPFTCYDSS